MTDKEPPGGSPRRRSSQVELIYLGVQPAAKGPVVRPRRTIAAIVTELFACGRFGGFGRTARWHGVELGS
jgi:hypothetical protein